MPGQLGSTPVASVCHSTCHPWLGKDVVSKIEITARGKPQDHIHLSPEMDKEEAERQLKSAATRIGAQQTVTLPWGVFSGSDVISAKLVPEASSHA